MVAVVLLWLCLGGGEVVRELVMAEREWMGICQWDRAGDQKRAMAARHGNGRDAKGVGGCELGSAEEGQGRWGCLGRSEARLNQTRLGITAGFPPSDADSTGAGRPGDGPTDKDNYYRSAQEQLLGYLGVVLA